MDDASQDVIQAAYKEFGLDYAERDTLASKVGVIIGSFSLKPEAIDNAVCALLKAWPEIQQNRTYSLKDFALAELYSTLLRNLILEYPKVFGMYADVRHIPKVPIARLASQPYKQHIVKGFGIIAATQILAMSAAYARVYELKFGADIKNDFGADGEALLKRIKPLRAIPGFDDAHDRFLAIFEKKTL